MVSKLATFRTDDETWDSFQSKAKRNGTNASALLQRFVRDYLDDKLDSRIDSPAVSDVDIQAMIDDAIAAKLSEIKDEIKEEYGAGFRGISANITDLLQQRDHEIDELKTAIAALTSEATAPAKKLKIVA
jgi:SpoVK/Ycf46/Vps4 family AAA+-type ATPase